MLFLSFSFFFLLNSQNKFINKIIKKNDYAPSNYKTQLFFPTFNTDVYIIYKQRPYLNMSLLIMIIIFDNHRVFDIWYETKFHKKKT